MCARPRCPEPASVGQYCLSHSPKTDSKTAKPRNRRGNSRARGYTRLYEKNRLIRIQRNPICQHEGCRRVVEETDHILPLALGGTSALSNLQSLCTEHHRDKSKADRSDILAECAKNFANR